MADSDPGSNAMISQFGDVGELDRLVHEPARLTLLTALTSCRAAEFVFLMQLLGLSGGNLSQHLTRLESAGLIQIDKGFARNRPQTMVRITERGRRALERHWLQLEKLRSMVVEPPNTRELSATEQATPETPFLGPRLVEEPS
jgi:DNA-binding MarR family transcriptional regulator